DRITGVFITRQGVSRFQERFERRVDPRGNVYYWLSGEMPVEETILDADAKILRENGISITPITYDLSCQDEIERLRSQPMPEYRDL
ncbi:MAG: 5'/3'-nucleotidase SurE, partial [Deltaproteobacteria bacterium]|nr:5'/3'-nucleotidase SurE [Deltaproteobacteria bacterium]